MYFCGAVGVFCELGLGHFTFGLVFLKSPGKMSFVIA